MLLLLRLLHSPGGRWRWPASVREPLADAGSRLVWARGFRLESWMPTGSELNTDRPWHFAGGLLYARTHVL